ncbi:MAG: hypothetical protein OXH76_05935 [Boseongicola sp.]|nr:hypothetical protein [Boseongicola sp.]
MAHLALTDPLLLAVFTRAGSHLSLAVDPFALGPFLEAFPAIKSAAYVLVACGAQHAMAITCLFASTALAFDGPQERFDAAPSRISPAATAAQMSIAMVMCRAVCRTVRLTCAKNRVTE